MIAVFRVSNGMGACSRHIFVAWRREAAAARTDMFHQQILSFGFSSGIHCSTFRFQFLLRTFHIQQNTHTGGVMEA